MGHFQQLVSRQYVLEQCSHSHPITQTLLPSLLYLLSLTVPSVPLPILHAKLSPLLQLVHRPLANPHLSAAAAAAAAAASAGSPAGDKKKGSNASATAENLAAQVRSALTILQSLLSRLPSGSGAGSPSQVAEVQQAFNSALALALDVRPKVRRKANECIAVVLLPQSPPHPYAQRVLHWLIACLQAVTDTTSTSSTTSAGAGAAAADGAQLTYDKKAGKARNNQAAAALRQSTAALLSAAAASSSSSSTGTASAATGGAAVPSQISASAGIWLCHLLKETLPRFNELGLLVASAEKSNGQKKKKNKEAADSASPLEKLVGALLRLPSLQNPFLSVAAFECFRALFRPHATSPAASTSAIASLDGAAAAAAASTAAPAAATNATTTSSHRELGLVTVRALRGEALREAAYGDAQLLPAYLNALSAALVSLASTSSPSSSPAAASWGGEGSSSTPTINLLQILVEVLDKGLAMEMGRKSKEARNAAKNLIIDLVRYTLPEELIAQAARAGTATSGKKAAATAEAGGPVAKVVSLLRDALSTNALKYAHAQSELLEIVVSLLSKLRVRVPSASSKASSSSSSGSRPPTAAELLCLPIVEHAAALRVSDGFQHREEVDAVLGMAVEVMGPRVVLARLPLGLFGENNDSIGRAWLLPLMRGRITNTELGHFVQEMVPLSEKLFERKVHAEESLAQANAAGGAANNKKYSVEAKMYEALTDQVWALFPGYCDLPTDLTSALTKKFAELLANVLYSQPALRPAVFRGLQLLVERNTALARSGAAAADMQASFGLTQADAKRNLAFLTSMAENLLAAYFNVFAQSPSNARGFVAEAITAYLEILAPEQAKKTYAKVLGMLQGALPQLENQHKSERGDAIPPPAYIMIDLLVLIVPHLAAEESTALFDLALGPDLLGNRDGGVQKKVYRLLTRVMEGKMASTVLLSKATPEQVRLQLLLRKLGEATENVSAGAKRDRVALLAALVPRIPATELHFLPSIIPEAVLGTKETNKAARQSSYDLLVLMGEKMRAGGKVKSGLVGATDAAEDDEDSENGDAAMREEGETKEATLEEYFTMVAAGLAGASPHMISATITSLSRLLFEYKDQLSANVLDEVVSTIEVFLRSPNREILKSALGCVKVAIVGLEYPLLDRHLAALTGAMLGFSSANKQHFKGKVRHIFERLIRRFGYNRIESLTDEDNKRLVSNIRKRKERARRKKAGQAEGGDDEDEEEDDGIAGRRKGKDVGVDAFEDALYGSDSDVSASESEDEVPQQKGNGRKQGRRQQQRQEQTYIREDDDQPLDLLDRNATAGQILTSADASHRSKNASGKRKQDDFGFSRDAETGKLLLRDSDDEGAGGKAGGADAMDVDGAGSAYINKGRGTDGYTTTKTGAVKFNKNTKRMRQEDLELEELIDQVEGASNAKKRAKAPKKVKQQIGSEFKAKKAQGDVSKKGVSPYAYGEFLPFP